MPIIEEEEGALENQSNFQGPPELLEQNLETTPINGHDQMLAAGGADIKYYKPVEAVARLRMKYLRRLTKEQIWLAPMKQPKSSQNLVIFDWDDTLFPTTYLNPVDDNMYELLREKFGPSLRMIEDEAIKLIQLTLKDALVVIITNAKKGWVEFSSSFFMPRLHALMMRGYLRVLSARVDYEEMYPFDTFKWKEMAFQKLWREENFLDRAAILNLIAIGDSDYEMEAAKLFAQ